MDKVQLDKILSNHKLWLKDSDKGKKADLSNVDLSSANLRYADLSNVDLSSANLRYADLSYADLSNADLSYADLSNVDLSNVDLSRANLRYTNLSSANLRYANLRSIDLKYANLSYADLCYADLKFADLRKTNLSNAYLDFSCLPLFCGGLNIKIDRKLAIQFLFHALNQNCEDKDFLEIRNDEKIIKFLKDFHRLSEVKPYWLKEGNNENTR